MFEISETKRTAIEAVVSGRKGKLDEFSLTEVFIQIYKSQAFYCSSWGQFLLYEGKYYKRYSQTEVHKMLVDIILDFFPDKVGKVTESFLSGARKLLQIRFPRQVEDTELAHGYIAFEDGMINTTEMEETLPHSSDILCFKFVDVRVQNFKDPSPTFDSYLETTLVNIDGEYDPQLSDLYQEMLGSLFCGKKAANRAFFLYDDGSNGKSITTEIILSLFEKQYHSSASLESLSRQFGKGRLVGKLVNVCTEEESQFLKHDVVKALVTGEQIDAEVKFGDSIAYHSFAKLLFATNSFPKFSGLDDAMKRRVIIVPFNAKFEGDSIDYDMEKKLREERAQIVGFALQGLKRLQDNKYQYTLGQSSKDAMMIFHEESSPVARYLNEEVEVDEMRMVEPIEARDLYAHYREWCKDNGHTPVASNRFAREMSSVDWLNKYKTRPRGTNLYFIHKPEDNLPAPIPPPYGDK